METSVVLLTDHVSRPAVPFHSSDRARHRRIASPARLRTPRSLAAGRGGGSEGGAGSPGRRPGAKADEPLSVRVPGGPVLGRGRWAHVLRSRLRRFVSADRRLQVALTDLESDAPREKWLGKVLRQVRRRFPRVEFGVDQGRVTGRGYYLGVCFKVYAMVDGEKLEIGDGGSVDWTRKLLSNAKERLFISALGSDRVSGLA